MVLPAALKALLPSTFHARCEGTRFEKHECIFLTGDKPEWMFFVVSGEVTLERTGLQGEPVVLQRTRQGFVSEASLKSVKYTATPSLLLTPLSSRFPSEICQLS